MRVIVRLYDIDALQAGPSNGEDATAAIATPIAKNEVGCEGGIPSGNRQANAPGSDRSGSGPEAGPKIGYCERWMVLSAV